MALIEKLPPNTRQVNSNGQRWIDIGTLAKNEDFDRIINSQTITCRDMGAYSNNISIISLQTEVDSQRTFNQRKKEIEQWAAVSENSASKRLRVLRAESANLRSIKFNEIARLNVVELNEFFDTFGENKELARFLILEGYLDDTYYQYTSLFHAGRLSPNDNKYLIQIRSFINPDPDFQIDNAKEVVAAMREGDFRQPYVLNVKIVDCLLGGDTTYPNQTAKMFEYLASDFENCEVFFTSYYAAGREVPKLVSGLQAMWPDLIPTVLSNIKHLSHVGQIIAHLPEPTLRDLPAEYPEISSFISENLARVLALGIDIDFDRLKAIMIELKDMRSIEAHHKIAQFLFDEGLYSISIENIEFIFQKILRIDDLGPLRMQNYTTIDGVSNASLSSRVERNFVDYLKNVLLRLEDNSRESVTAILSIIGREDADFYDLRAFLERQSAIIPSLNDVPVRFHALVFQLNRIEASWANCLAFVDSDAFDAEILTGFLETKAALATLPQQTIPDDDKAAALRQFLINDNALLDGTYRTYVRGLPRPFTNFPSSLGPDKLRILIEESKITFSKINIDVLQDKMDLKVLFVVKNIEKYLKDEDKYAFDDDFRERLLEENVDENLKIMIIHSMNLSLLAGLPLRAGKVGPILDRAGAKIRTLDSGAARAVILNSAPTPIQISLFNKCQEFLSDSDVRGILAGLPAPFSDIKTGYRSPTIKKTDINVEFVKWLDKRNIISSWSLNFLGDEIRINLYRRDSRSQI